MEFIPLPVLFSFGKLQRHVHRCGELENHESATFPYMVPAVNVNVKFQLRDAQACAPAGYLGISIAGLTIVSKL